MELSETSGAAKRRKRRLKAKEFSRAMKSEPPDGSQGKDIFLDVTSGKNFLLKVKVHIPVDEHPNFNFIGQLLGPKGSSLQQLQEATQTKMVILGRGSMRDKKKEEELRKKGDPKHAHLNEKLHLEIASYAVPAEAYLRMASALTEVERFLVPGYEEPANEFNRCGEIYDHYKPRNAPCYDCAPDQPLYAASDPFADRRYNALPRPPRGRGLRFMRPPLMRRPQTHPYAGAARRGY